MAKGEFRCAFFARDYDSTVTFYRDALGLPVVEAWDRSRDDRGTLLQAASGLIEVLALPKEPEQGSAWDYREPQGVCMLVEVGRVDDLYRRVLARNLPVKEPLKNQAWGHRSFIVSDPNGLRVYFFSLSSSLAAS